MNLCSSQLNARRTIADASTPYDLSNYSRFCKQSNNEHDETVVMSRLRASSSAFQLSNQILNQTIV